MKTLDGSAEIGKHYLLEGHFISGWLRDSKRVALYRFLELVKIQTTEGLQRIGQHSLSESILLCRRSLFAG